METDITPIFKTNEGQPGEQAPPPTPQFEDPRPEPPNFQEPIRQDEEFTPIDDIQDEQSYHHPPIMHHGPPQPHPYYWPQMSPPPQPQPQWDPFKNISTSTWIILIVAFALGFFIGKFK